MWTEINRLKQQSQNSQILHLLRILTNKNILTSVFTDTVIYVVIEITTKHEKDKKNGTLYKYSILKPFFVLDLEVVENVQILV